MLLTASIQWSAEDEMIFAALLISSGLTRMATCSLNHVVMFTLRVSEVSLWTCVRHRTTSGPAVMFSPTARPNQMSCCSITS